MIAVVDYGAGNLHSVCNALDLFGVEYRVVRRPDELAGAERILLPGVGHFGQMMRSLAETGMDAALKAEVGQGKPLLGICLGMQALYESSEEALGLPGLGFIEGEIKRFQDVPRIPHMGWNDVAPLGSKTLTPQYPNTLAAFYFANSFYAAVDEFTTGVCEYGVAFAATVRKGNVSGAQFHPEKSGEAGLRFLREWCEAC